MVTDKFKQYADTIGDVCPPQDEVVDRVAALVREEFSPTDADPLVVVSCSVGTAVKDGVLDGEGRLNRMERRVAGPLHWWFKYCDPDRHRLGMVWWFVLSVAATKVSLEGSRDEWPPEWVQAVLRETGLNLDSPTLWFLQRLGFDERPAGLLPAWWVEKLRSVGAWDEEKGEFAADAIGNPMFGKKLILDSSPDDDGPDDEVVDVPQPPVSKIPNRGPKQG